MSSNLYQTLQVSLYDVFSLEFIYLCEIRD